MKTLQFAKTSSFFKLINVLYLLKEISCNHDYSAFKKYTVSRGLCWNRERENDPHADGPSGLANTLSLFCGLCELCWLQNRQSAANFNTYQGKRHMNFGLFGTRSTVIIKATNLMPCASNTFENHTRVSWFIWLLKYLFKV